MLQGTRMRADDAPHGSLAVAYIKLADGNRYKMIQMTEFESKAEPKITDVKILGQVELGHKAAGVSYTWKAKGYLNHPIFQKMMLEYSQTGIMPRFDIEVTNHDPASAAGMQTIIHRGCLLDSVTLSKFEAGENTLEVDVSGTHESFDMPQQFSILNGMNA